MVEGLRDIGGKGILGGRGARVGGDAPDGVDGLLCESLEWSVGEVEGAIGSLTSGGKCTVDEGEDVLAPGDTACGVGGALCGFPCLLEGLEGR